jgi:hypothetical protein
MVVGKDTARTESSSQFRGRSYLQDQDELQDILAISTSKCSYFEMCVYVVTEWVVSNSHETESLIKNPDTFCSCQGFL